MHASFHASISQEITTWYPNLGPWLFYLAVWGLIFAGTGLFIGAFIPFVTGDSLVFAAGLVAAGNGDVNIWVMAVGIGVAAWLGDQVGYTIGSHYGRPYLDKRQGRWIQAGIRKSEDFYNRWGWAAVVVGRFIPWARVFVPPIAGIAKMNYYKFFSSNLLGAVVWGCGLNVTGYFAASNPALEKASYAIAAFFILASVAVGARSWLKNRKAA